MEKYPRGTQVFKTRVSPFYFFVLLPRMRFLLLLFVLRRCRSEDQIVHPAFNCPINQIGSPSVQSTRSSLRSSFVLRSSRRLFNLFFKSFLLCCSPKLSIKDSILLFRIRVYETQDLCDIILSTHQVEIKSLTLKF